MFLAAFEKRGTFAPGAAAGRATARRRPGRGVGGFGAAQYTDLKDGGKEVLGKSGVTAYKAGWTDDRPAVAAAS
ncbi:hypothetical protein ABT158_45245 [Nonomuraea sp. NPDC001636]|uniref:hypothetical protein n=1 Tax=Nonomuraea sp. NPDC001636 TaxID=3154391 RepID=UPI003320EF08